MAAPTDWTPLFASIRIAATSTLLSTLVGVPTAWAISRGKHRARAAWDSVVTLPLVLPPTVLGYYLLVAFGAHSAFGRAYQRLFGTPLVFSWQGAALAVAIVSMPFLIRTLQVAFMEIDPCILDSARLEGASERAILFRMLLPLARPALWGGIALAFARALGDFGVTLMVGGNIPGSAGTHTLSMAIYDSINAGDDSTAVAFVWALTAISVVVSVFASLQASKSRK
jgi:molybdate transport system permease protein